MIELLVLASALGTQEMAQDWWQWMATIPNDNNPQNDTTGEKTEKANKYNGVYFLVGAGNTTSPQHRNITISQNSSLFFPVINAGYADLKTWYSQLSDLITGSDIHSKLLNANHIANVDITKNIHATLDGKAIPIKRITTPVYDVVYIKDNVYKIPAGHHPTVVDGYWSYIESLPTGNHILTFGGATPPRYSTAVIYNIEVAK